MSMSPRPARALAVAGALWVAVAAAPAVSTASPYEQVNRATGAAGGSPLWGVRDQGTAVGDLGRYAGWERWSSGSEVPQGFVRDIVLNRTLDYGGNVQRVYGFDRFEQRALILRTRAGQRQVVVVPIAGGAPIVIAQFPVGGRLPEAALSGDGRVAVVSTEGWGTKAFNLTGGVARLTRTLTTKYFERFPARGISDSGSVVLGYDPNETSSLIVYRNGVEGVLAGRATTGAVSADGSTVAWVATRDDGYYELNLRNLAAGTQRSFPLPANDPRGGAEAGWVANGGAKTVVGYASNGYVEAQEFTPGVGATGTWTRFGAPRYSPSVQGELQSTPLSANRRFAVTGPNQLSRAVALFDTTGAHIIGANEGFSAASYIRAGSFVSTCDQPTEFYVSLGQPTTYAPHPVKAVVTVKVDGQTVASGTLTKSISYGYYGPLPEDDPALLIRAEYGPAATAGDVQLTASVTDAAGRVLTETWSEPDLDCAG